ncbi:hypothetical protein FQN55_007134 [Onygenales sp. PD_40]|nr:hypothetical protein FQN55_007134 [Onygenales sp. PD_40]
MVSFQCEGCGDVLTKKKTDSHRNQCRANLSCLDCSTEFPGTSYRSHTSCISEAQKYQGALYKEKPGKPKKTKSVTIVETPISKPPRHPYVEDAPDIDDIRPNNQVPPYAPSPPPATPQLESGKDASGQPVNVFDFLVAADTPNASKLSVGGSKEPMTMVKHAPPLFNAPKELAKLDNGRDDEVVYDLAYEENGFSYGADSFEAPFYQNAPENESTASMAFVTPAPRRNKDHSQQDRNASPDHSRTNSIAGTGDKKRKRGHIEEIDPAVANSRYTDDIPMTDAPPSSLRANPETPSLNHSGLTGDLKRMMRRDYSPTPDRDYASDDAPENGRSRSQDPVSPIKRTRRADKESASNGNNENGLGIAIKGRAGRIISILGGAGGVGVAALNGTSNDPSSRALVRTRRRSSSDGIEPASNSRALIPARKTKKRHRVETKTKRRSSNSNGHYDERAPRRLKALEYHPHGEGSDSENRSRSPNGAGGRVSSRGSKNTSNQLVVYRNGEDSSSQELAQRERASVFLSLVTKGPDSERGCSVHKALKRYHRDYPSSVGSEEREREKDKDKDRGRGRERGRGRGRDRDRDRDRKGEEEKELWRALRLRRNERGEVVVFV